MNRGISILAHGTTSNNKGTYEPSNFRHSWLTTISVGRGRRRAGTRDLVMVVGRGPWRAGTWGGRRAWTWGLVMVVGRGHWRAGTWGGRRAGTWGRRRARTWGLVIFGGRDRRRAGIRGWGYRGTWSRMGHLLGIRLVGFSSKYSKIIVRTRVTKFEALQVLPVYISLVDAVSLCRVGRQSLARLCQAL